MIHQTFWLKWASIQNCQKRVYLNREETEKTEFIAILSGHFVSLRYFLFKFLSVFELKCNRNPDKLEHENCLLRNNSRWSHGYRRYIILNRRETELAEFYILALRSLSICGYFLPIRYKLLNQIRQISSLRIQMYLCVKVSNTCTRRSKKSSWKSISGTNLRSTCRKRVLRTDEEWTG